MIFANAELILADHVIRGAVHVQDGMIVEITEGGVVPPGAIDCQGSHLAPGLIELHTDNVERHLMPRPGVDWPHRAAILAHDGELASVGITTVFDSLRVGGRLHDGQKYEQYARLLATEINTLTAAKKTRISHWLHLRAEICSETLLDELAMFGPDDRVKLLSLMDHTPGQRQFRDLSKLAQYTQGKTGMSDQQFESHVAELIEMRNCYGESHETGAVAAAKRIGAALASHDDTTAEQVAISAAHGISLAEFPTTVEAASACHDNRISVMMGGPNLIRGGSHSGNVAAETLAHEGLLDVLSSDYIPASLFLGACHLAGLWGDLPKAFATVTKSPAIATGLTDRGRIEAGLRADLIRIAELEEIPRIAGVWVRGVQVG